MYLKMDPSDSTHWKSTSAASPVNALSKKKQLKQISVFKNMLEHELTTTPTADSASAKKLRKSLRDLLLRKQQLQAAIRTGEDSVLKHSGAASMWTTAVRPDPAQNEDTIRRLARADDSHASYAAWLRAAAADPTPGSRAAARRASSLHPHISAGGALVWNGPAGAGGAKRAARTQSLAGRDPLLEPDDTGSESWSQLKQRANHKVARWMGAGYYPVFG